MGLTGCSVPATTHLKSTTVPTSATSTTAATTVCLGSQLKGELTGVYGAVGTWVAEYWFGDTSGQPCLLQSPIDVELLDGGGVVHLTATAAFTPLSLAPIRTLPATTTSPSPGEVAASAVSWPIIPDANRGRCPTTTFTPSSVRFTFGGGAFVTVSGASPNGGFDICGTNVAVVTPSAL